MLPGLPSVASLSLLSHTTQDHLPKVGPVTSIIDQGNDPIDLPPDQFDRRVFSIEVPSSQRTLICIKVTKTKPNKRDARTLCLWYSAIATTKV